MCVYVTAFIVMSGKLQLCPVSFKVLFTFLQLFIPAVFFTGIWTIILSLLLS